MRGRAAKRAPGPEDVRGFCLRILERGDLVTKLEPPRRADGSPLDDTEPGPARWLRRPVRDAELAPGARAGRLPSLRNLGDPAARAACLARFAHHELMTVELFAWALLRWPALPPPLRRGWLQVLADEQRHCRLYLDRLAAHGSSLSAHPVSDYFWRQVPNIAASRHGPRAFLCALGLTLEQANLDFSLLYASAFREAGDEASARVCEQVHEDEVRHVRLATTWLRRLGGARDDSQDLALYREAVPFPLSAARAKGRHFDATARKRAGLSDAFVEHVRTARSSGGGRRTR